MKKVLFILTLVLALVVSSVAFARCDLNMQRWKFIGNSSGGSAHFIDTGSVLFDGRYAQVWDCGYYQTSCKDHKYEHYHYTLWLIDYGKNAIAVREAYKRKPDGKTFGKEHYYDDEIEFISIHPESMGELIARETYAIVRR